MVVVGTSVVGEDVDGLVVGQDPRIACSGGVAAEACTLTNPGRSNRAALSLASADVSMVMIRALPWTNPVESIPSSPSASGTLPRVDSLTSAPRSELSATS